MKKIRTPHPSILLLTIALAASLGSAGTDESKPANASDRAFIDGASGGQAASGDPADDDRTESDRPRADRVRAYAITEEREPCADYSPLRRPFFGDTHVHTAYSQDASTQDTRTTPRQAYAFAQGKPLGIQPFDAEGNSKRQVALHRPLDFAIVTDHAEQLGEVHICKTPGLEGHDSLVCRLYRNFPRVAFYVMNGQYSVNGERWGFCGENNEYCFAAARTIWQDHQAAAEEAYDRSAQCAFTTFVGYEWTSVGGQGTVGGHLHRNVIFRNERVPNVPISVMETGPIAMNLWKGLDENCRDAGIGCEAITIPHNMNWSAGSAFSSASADSLFGPITEEEAPIRLRYDRLAEIMQHKGESECALVPGVTDEGCGFEKVFDTNNIPFVSEEPKLEAINFSRDALERGLALEPKLGANPFKFGVIGSTDTHLGTPGLVREKGFEGHGGAGMPNRDEMPSGLPEIVGLNPGGLAVVWAEENSRDAIFAGMQRREAYATSGTRPTLRFFGGWDYEASDCEAPDPAVRGYAGGVPMGGDLPAPLRSGQAPSFLVAASRDPDPELAELDRIEIVKGWVEGGERKERVLTITGGDRATSVDLNTCERSGTGHAQLCTVWRDPDFDPAEPAFYYARLRESPTCRWSQWACIEGGVDCADPSTITEGFEPCCAPDHQPIIQERAWSSPIWYTPASEDGPDTGAQQSADASASVPASTTR
jgi:hypothetical protein